MTLNDQQESIGVGWDVPLVSLIRISSIKPTDDEYFADPKSTGLYNLGMAKIDGDGNVKLIGFRMAPWGFTRLTWLQWYYASSTWCGNGLSGPVTILTPLNSHNGTYTRVNAILILPNPSEMHSEYRYNDVQFKFTRLRTPS
jgi:hypothetical protein